MASFEEKIAAAEKRAQEAAKQVKQLKAKRDMVEARKLQSLLKGQRSDDTRRKILVGVAACNPKRRARNQRAFSAQINGD